MSVFQAGHYRLLFILALSLPLLLVSASALTAAAVLRAEPLRRRAALAALQGTAGFVLLDVLLLIALPWFNLSYGPITLAVIFLAGMRLLFLLVGCMLLVRSTRPVSWLPLWIVNGLLALLVFYGFYIEPFNIHVTRVEMSAPAAQISHKLRIVQLSDVHVERITRRERALIPIIRDLKPDILVLTGDYLNVSFLKDSSAMQDAHWLFSQLTQPDSLPAGGVYAVNGSVDNPARMEGLFGDLPVTVLKDQYERVKIPGSNLYVIGVNDWEPARDEAELRMLMHYLPRDAFSLFLFHTPDMIDAAAQSGVDLYLAGHTHGGQIRLPVYGAVFTASKYGKKYEMGLYNVDGTTLYVNRGLGMEGGNAPRARFLASPEVLVIDLIPEP